MDELSKVLKEVANRDLLKTEVGVLATQRKDMVDNNAVLKSALLKENRRIKLENEVLDKQLLEKKTQLTNLTNKKTSLELLLESERKKINLDIEAINQTKVDLKSEEDRLKSLDGEIRKKVVGISKREQETNEKESSLSLQLINIGVEKVDNTRIKNEIEAIRNSNKEEEESSRESLEELVKQQEINKGQIEKISALSISSTMKRKEIESLDEETQNKVKASETKLKEITEREAKIAKAVENMENRERQVEIDKKNILIAKADIEIKEKLLKEKLLTLKVK